MGNNNDGKAKTDKKIFSRTTTIEIEIKADVKKVWSLLTDARSYPKWNSTIISIEGDIDFGKQIKLKSILDSKRLFTLKVKRLETNKILEWGDSMGSRIFELNNYGGKVLFSMTEKIGGPLFPLFSGMIPPFDEMFEKFASDLKKEAEKE